MRKDDMPRIQQMHADCGFKWQLPTFDEPEILDTLVYVDDRDVPQIMLGSRKAAEMFMLMDNGFGSPGERNAAFGGIYRAMEQSLYAQGYREALAFIPPTIEKAFWRRLRTKWGWYRSSWNVFLAQISSQ